MPTRTYRSCVDIPPDHYGMRGKECAHLLASRAAVAKKITMDKGGSVTAIYGQLRADDTGTVDTAWWRMLALTN